MSNLSTSFGVLMRFPGQATEERFARVKVPTVFPNWIQLPSAVPGLFRFLSLHEIIANHLSALFPGMEIVDVLSFRITRNADIERDEEDAEDLLEMVAEELRERRFASVVRLEHGPKPNPRILELLMEALDLTTEDIYELSQPLECLSLGPDLRSEPSGAQISVLDPAHARPRSPRSRPIFSSSSPRVTSCSIIRTKASTRASSVLSAAPSTIRKSSQSR